MIDRLADYWSSKKPKRSKLWRWLSFLLTIAMVAYLAYAFTQGGLRLDQIDWKAYGGAVLAVLGIYLMSLIIQFYVWTRIISFHRKVSWQDVDIYARMILMRSLPGGAWHWVGRISMYSGGTEVPTRVVVLGNFLEWALLTLSGVGIFFTTLPLPGLGFPLAALTFGAALALAISWQPATQKWTIRLAEGSLWIALYSMAWFLAAMILYIMAQAVAGSGQLDVMEILRACTFTGSLGMLISMLPSSLGVREISLVWMLQATLTPSVALLIALMLRILYTLADAIWGMIGWLISTLIMRKRQPIL
ncbi:MAG: hypothetical protein Q8L87_16465 [Anaerolineales bacterium]|nr:hypothetical protein [Anaerolineales bacterium]